MKLLFVYPPFCTPASPPYSLVNLYAFLKNNCKADLHVLDLNVWLHAQKYPSEQKYYQALDTNYSHEEYTQVTSDFLKSTKQWYAENNKTIREGGTPELFKEVLFQILKQQPDIVAFSLVYSSQAFYTLALIEELKKHGITTIIGGPAINERLRAAADATLGNEIELLEYITAEKSDHTTLNFETVLDFSVLDTKQYFIPSLVLPIKTSNTCFYQKCAFCTHHTGGKYLEFPLKNIARAIEQSHCDHVFFTDDMIHTKRLLEIASIVKPLNITWMCQLRPTCDLTKEVLQELYNSGLRHVIWGVESGSDRVLDAMHKGTNSTDAAKVLLDAHEVGIKNGAYILFGFPTETQEEFMETIDFLRGNSDAIDIVSPALFGLQKGAPAFKEPQKYGIKDVTEEARTVLGPKISYATHQGLSREEVVSLKNKYKHMLESINKFPKSMNFFREHLLCILGKLK